MNRSITQSISQPLSRHHFAARSEAVDFNTAWGITMPADLVPATLPDAAPIAYHEHIRGLITREVNEPELFKQFFG